MTISLHRHYQTQGNHHTKVLVFRQLQKTGRDSEDVIWHGRVFQVPAAAIGIAIDRGRLTVMYSGQAVMTSTLIVGGV